MRIIHFTAVIAMAVSLAGHASAAPQDSGEQSLALAGAEAACLSRTIGGPDGDRQLAIVVRASDAAAMATKGFVRIRCRDAFASRAAALEYRDRACSIASIRNRDLQDRLERQLGERPATLCGMAELVLGQWQREDAR